MKQRQEDGVKEQVIQIKHTWTARIIDTGLRSAYQGNTMTYPQGVTEDMSAEDKNMLLISEITQEHSPRRYDFMTEVSQ